MSRQRQKIKELLRIEQAKPHYEFGKEVWRLPDGRDHRDYGPAVLFQDGSKIWCRYGKPHRTEGPAIMDAEGSEFWFYKGIRHRLGGPAVTFYNGDKEWWIFGMSFLQMYIATLISFFIYGIICLSPYS
jgi:hypothetical protein